MTPVLLDLAVDMYCATLITGIIFGYLRTRARKEVKRRARKKRRL